MLDDVSKSLDGTEHVIDGVFDWKKYIEDQKRHYPDMIIAAFLSFGLNTRICIDYSRESSLFLLGETVVEGDDSTLKGKYAYVRDVQRDGKFVHIIAERKKSDDDKLKLVSAVMDKIDCGTGNDFFVEMLCNVFTMKRLVELLKSNDIEILSFNGVMYLRSGDNAFRL